MARGLKNIKKSKRYLRIRRKIKKVPALASIMSFTKAVFLTKHQKARLDGYIERYNPKNDTMSTLERFKEYYRLIYHELVYYIRGDNYYYYNIAGKTHEEKKAFVGSTEKYKALEALIRKYPDKNWSFKDKYATYEMLAKYFNRDIIKIDNSFDKEKFAKFAAEHDDFFVKENRGSFGAGAYAIHMKRETRSIDELFDLVLESAPCVIEERITQDPAMAAFHPDSVNSIRFVTYWQMNGQLRRVYANIRMGQGGSVVDNAGAGGIIADVDLETGIICTDGFGEKDHRAYKIHPDTGHSIKGVQIPAWEELLKLIDEMAEITKNRWYVGWDLAYSDRGWTVIEVNDNPGIVGPQITHQRGVRQMFNETIQERKLAKKNRTNLDLEEEMDIDLSEEDSSDSSDL